MHGYYILKHDTLWRNFEQVGGAVWHRGSGCSHGDWKVPSLNPRTRRLRPLLGPLTASHGLSETTFTKNICCLR